MLISYQYNFIFIHVCKTAGSSIRSALEPFANPNPRDRFSKLVSKLALNRQSERPYLPKHADTSYFKRRIDEDQFGNMYKFAFVRNPWDLLVSAYHYIQKNPKHHRHSKVVSMPDFKTYVNYEIDRNKLHQHTVLCDTQGQLQVDYLGRFERLEQDFASICRNLGIIAQLPHFNSSTRSDYRDYFSKTLRQKVEAHWAKDIEHFGYSY